MSAWFRRVSTVAQPEAAALGDALAYELISVLWSGSVVTLVLWSALGGRADDVYAWLGGSAAPEATHTAVIEIGPSAMALWGVPDAETAAIPHDLVAEVVDFARVAGARTVALDLLLDRPGEDASATQRLAEAARAHGRVVVATQYVTFGANRTSFAVPPLPELEPHVLPGFANLVKEQARLFDDPNSPGIVREVYLQKELETTQAHATWTERAMHMESKQPTPSFALAAAWTHVNDTVSSPETPRTLSVDLKACSTDPAACGALALPGITTDQMLEPFPIPYRGRAGMDGIPTVDASAVLTLAATARTSGWDAVDYGPVAQQLRGRLVVIGRVGDATDRHLTPGAPPLVGRPDSDGVRIQAQVMEALLTGRRLRRFDGTWLGGVVAAIVTATLWHTHARMSAVGRAAVVLGGATLLLSLGVALYRFADVSLPLGAPIGAATVTWSILRLRARMSAQPPETRALTPAQGPAHDTLSSAD